uniref:Uncharacterized protein n=1 Tax=Eutreptiella gymnastica TaxID=73025 RepID=A0A7S4GF32_9EUGL
MAACVRVCVCVCVCVKANSPLIARPAICDVQACGSMPYEPSQKQDDLNLLLVGWAPLLLRPCKCRPGAGQFQGKSFKYQATNPQEGVEAELLMDQAIPRIVVQLPFVGQCPMCCRGLAPPDAENDQHDPTGGRVALFGGRHLKASAALIGRRRRGGGIFTQDCTAPTITDGKIRAEVQVCRPHEEGRAAPDLASSQGLAPMPIHDGMQR